MARSRSRRGAERCRLDPGAAGAICLAALVLVLACPAAQAQTAVGALSGLSNADSKQPIDIESDQLEVDDKRHMAIFSGSVSATQGTNNLKAPRLEVFYDTKQQKAGGGKTTHGFQEAGPVKPASANVAADPVTGGQITMIHATGGRVVVSSTKDQQEAKGDDAIFDVNAQLITMTGKEVVLSQGLSEVKGTKLVIDLKTGKANLVTGEAEGAGTAASASGKPRVRATFQQQTGPDGKPINPLTSLNPGASKKAPPAESKKNTGTASQPAKKTAVPPGHDETPSSPDWQTQSR
jgi:lipopolysaccharide export system protein LptA